MLTRSALKGFGRHCAVAALLFGVAMSFDGTMQVSAQPDASTFQTIRFASTPGLDGAQDAEVKSAITTFIRGMSDADAATVWMFASEEDQAAFATEQAVFAAFADTFPAFTKVSEVTFEEIWQEGDTPFAKLSMTDAAGDHYLATVGLWLDDAGDWKLISCDIKPVSDRIASL